MSAYEELIQHQRAIKLALSQSSEEIVRGALQRFGPVPEHCTQCLQNPASVVQINENGRWVCRQCAGLENKL